MKPPKQRKLLQPAKGRHLLRVKKHTPVVQQPEYIEQKVEEERYPELDAAFAEMDHIKALGQRFLQLEEEAVNLFHRYGLKTYRGRTLVEGVTTTIDYDGLMAELTPEQRALVCREVIDPAKLEAAIRLGQISAKAVKKFTSEKPRKPYFTRIREGVF